MITEKETIDELVPEDLAKKIVDVSMGFSGQIDDLYTAVGIIVIGRLFGWRVMRLVVPRRVWKKTSDIFGDPKELMGKEKGDLYHRSFGVEIADRIGGYWDFVRGYKAMDLEDKRTIKS